MAGNFQVSSKMNDGRIFVVAGETYTQFKENLEALVGTVDADVIMNTMTSSLVGSVVPSPTQTQAEYANLDAASARIAAAFPGSTVVNPTPPGYGNAAAPSGRECKHGPMTKREGAGAKGPWKGFMCPTPKGTPDQCEPVFVKRGTPEWNNF
jgi:hypothetical protein